MKKIKGRIERKGFFPFFIPFALRPWGSQDVRAQRAQLHDGIAREAHRLQVDEPCRAALGAHDAPLALHAAGPNGEHADAVVAHALRERRHGAVEGGLVA